jgi:hypothetical protein
MERVPFDYDKYAADPASWMVFTKDNAEVVYLLESIDEDDNYPLKGVYKLPDGYAQEATWDKQGLFVTDNPDSDRNISHMIAVHKVKPAETKVVSSLTPRLRNVYYNYVSKAVEIGTKTHETWTDAMLSANRTMANSTALEHLCVATLEDHPQIKEILIAKGLAEVVVNPELKEIDL